MNMNVPASGVVMGLAIALLCHTTWTSAMDKSGVSPNTISLPSGRGSIEGLGESFQPELNTGTATYGIDLALPPGAAGHQPALALQYNGGHGNGPLGFGWRIPTPFVQRQRDKGILLNSDFVGLRRDAPSPDGERVGNA